MTVSLPISGPEYAVAEKALRRWAAERLRRAPREGGGSVYTFALTGSTCTNRPLEVLMTVELGPDGRIASATSQPAPHDAGCDAMCAAVGCDGRQFLAESGRCHEAVGLTLAEAAFRDWPVEPSGCFCTSGNRLHKWRNVFQTLHYATATDHILAPDGSSQARRAAPL
jgi:hypothetical protein